MLKYLQVPWNTHLDLVFFKSSEKGLTHFRDVRHLIMVNNACLIIFGIASYTIIKYWIKRDFLWLLINPIKEFLTLVIVLMSIALVNFQNFFIEFHRIMFRNYDWVFGVRSDPIITVLPDGFFAWCFVSFAVYMLIILLLVIHYSK